jgi:hypothetical protein
VGLDYWVWPGRLAVLGSSLSAAFARLPARALSARLPEGADPAPGIQGSRAPGAPARERGIAPPDQPGPLPARRPAMAGSTVATGPAQAMGRGVRGDAGDAARLAPAAGRPHTELHQPRHPGRPSTAAAIRKPVIGIATDNPTWGHRRVPGELVKLGHPIAASTVWQIRHAAGINPAPRRKPDFVTYCVQAYGRYTDGYFSFEARPRPTRWLRPSRRRGHHPQPGGIPATR